MPVVWPALDSNRYLVHFCIFSIMDSHIHLFVIRKSIRISICIYVLVFLAIVSNDSCPVCIECKRLCVAILSLAQTLVPFFLFCVNASLPPLPAPFPLSTIWQLLLKWNNYLGWPCKTIFFKEKKTEHMSNYSERGATPWQSLHSSMYMTAFVYCFRHWASRQRQYVAIRIVWMLLPSNANTNSYRKPSNIHFPGLLTNSLLHGKKTTSKQRLDAFRFIEWSTFSHVWAHWP